MTKKELRANYKKLRQGISKDQLEAMSLAIANRVLSLDIWNHHNFHLFLPIAHHNEINTEYLLHLLSGKDKNVVISRSNFEDLVMTHFLLTDNTRIMKNAYGIPEPHGEEHSLISIADEKIDVVFVPLLAFDEYGNRIGYGKGFYDKFLTKCRPETVKIGLSFFEAVAPWDDVFESDVKLDYCVTPVKTYVF